MAKRKKKRSKRSFSAKAPRPIVNIAQQRSVRQPLQPGRKPSVFLASITVTGRVHCSHSMAFAKAIASLANPQSPLTFTVHIEAGKRGVDYARNCVVREFMKSDCDWLVMVDEDQVVPDNFWQLCAVNDADVVSGITPVWVGNMEPESMLRVNNYGVDEEGQCFNLPVPDESVKQPYRVPIVGTGCIAIRRRVFAPKPSGVGQTPFYFTYEDDRKVKAGEDINFGVDCNKAGFVLCVHPLVPFDHVKEIPLLQVSRYYDARKKMEDSGKSLTEKQRLSIG